VVHLLFNTDIDAFGHMNLVLLFGLVVLAGTFSARLFQKFHIPQVVGCVVVGIVLGDVLKVITPARIDALSPFTMFALGIIGFMIGSELRGDIFKKGYNKSKATAFIKSLILLFYG